MSTRYISHFHPPRTDPSTARAAILDALSQNVELVHEYYASHPSDVSVYIGSSGIATMDNYLSELSLPELPSHLFRGSDRYLHPALSRSSSKALAHPRDASKTGFLVSSIGLGTLILLRALQPPSEQRQSDTETQAQKTLSDAVPTSLELLNAALQLALALEHTATDDGCEVLYGRAGLLYALLRLRSTSDRNSSASTSARPPINPAVQTLVTNTVLTQLVDAIIQRGKNGSAAYAAELASASVRVTASPLMWTWHGKRYLGGAHGVVGILQMILSSPADCITMHIPILLDTVDWLLECKGGHRNWPSVAPTSSTTHRSDLLQCV
ncbi:hypothetical protein PILCRDRAFT_310248 [Piloderma croceum F 1598]|uniref:Uncharacterized protein n=1 Tax=Piloderma croceum (strain F 1598) TaxID=765440 RepID=A0A0C3FRT0_PILCF|nr:hypothetical protein PILCRDRAFT_310248 [Piloderma croceum F 1598]